MQNLATIRLHKHRFNITAIHDSRNQIDHLLHRPASPHRKIKSLPPHLGLNPSIVQSHIRLNQVFYVQIIALEMAKFGQPDNRRFPFIKTANTARNEAARMRVATTINIAKVSDRNWQPIAMSISLGYQILT